VDAKSTLSGRSAQPGHERGLAELRSLLVGDQLGQLEELRKRLDDPNVRSRETSKILAEALAISIRQDPKIHKALQPLVEESLRLSVERNPNLLASALFPIVGQAVRKSVAHSLQHLVDSLNSILAEGFSLKRWRWRLEAIRSGKSFGEVALARSLDYAVEHLYLIHRETGLLLAEDSNTLGLLEDADLVVGMLIALQDFVRDSFIHGKQEDLEVLDIGEFKVWLLHGPLAILAVVARGQLPEEVRAQLASVVENIHKDFRGQLATFATSGQQVAGLETYLNGCLKSTTSVQKPSYTRFNVAAILLLCLIFAALFVQVRDGLRWRNYLNALRREPGIVVLEEHHGWSSFSVTGLRDPMALKPESLLAEFHLSGNKVSENWEGYLSLDPHLSSARRLNEETDALRKEVIRFEVNTTTIPLDQLPLVDSVSDQIHQLSLDAASQDKEINVKIFGHTDRTGAESRNTQLSQERAETMIRLLTERGVAPGILSSEGLGDKQPRRAGADSYEQNLDRRVTFSVSLKPVGLNPEKVAQEKPL
jgi:outer membrane protein OmpA-like peptidoglycan-associated protein